MKATYYTLLTLAVAALIASWVFDGYKWLLWVGVGFGVVAFFFSPRRQRMSRQHNDPV